MKLRIQSNSIRLRLTQTEVGQIEQGSAVQACVSFGQSTPPFRYTLLPNPESEAVTVQYADHELRVAIPQKKAYAWASTDQIGIEENISLDNGDALHILVEKDFQCLHKRPQEDESDHFPNPAAENS